MMIGERIREIRQAKGLTQRVIQKRTGLMSAYVSRVEHNHTVPSVETLNKFARGLEVPIYAFFFPAVESPEKPAARKDDLIPPRILSLLRKMGERERELMLEAGKAMVKRKRRP